MGDSNVDRGVQSVCIGSLLLPQIKALCDTKKAVVIFPDLTRKAMVYDMPEEPTLAQMLAMLELSSGDYVQFVPIASKGLALWCDENGAVKDPAAAVNQHASLVAGKFVYGGQLLGPIIFLQLA